VGGSFIISAVGNGRDEFRIDLLGLKQSSCVALVAKLSNTGAPKGLASMDINGTNQTLPVSPEDAGVACAVPAGLNNQLTMRYKIRI
jgi:hypothetical protein